MNEIAQFDVLRRWLMPLLGLDNVIRAYPAGPRPLGPYATLNCISAEALGRAFHKHTVQDDERTSSTGATAGPEEVFYAQRLHTEMEYIWSLSVYGDAAINFLSRIKAAVCSDLALSQLHPLTLGRVSVIRRLPELIGDKWEDRAQCDLFVRLIEVQDYGGDVAETVNFTVDNDFGLVLSGGPVTSEGS